MPTFQSGRFSTTFERSESLSTLIAMAEESNRLACKAVVDEMLRKSEHCHNFDPLNWKCSCGMTLLEYHGTLVKDRQVCQVALDSQPPDANP